MKFSAAAARRFSASLLRVHTAGSLAGVRAAVVAAESALCSDPGLLALLREHGEQRRAQLCRPVPSSPRALATLTRRELEVLGHVSRGETDAAIGRALAIAPKTASKHVENILRKLRVETRTAAAMQAQPRRIGV